MEGTSANEIGDLDSLFAEVNNLPAEDPLRASDESAVRAPAQPSGAVVKVADKGSTGKASGMMSLLPAKVVAAFRAASGGEPVAETAAVVAPRLGPVGSARVVSRGAVTVGVGGEGGSAGVWWGGVAIGGGARGCCGTARAAGWEWAGAGAGSGGGDDGAGGD